MNATPPAEDASNQDPTRRQGTVNEAPTPLSARAWLGSAVALYGVLAAIALGWSAWAGTPWAFVDRAAQDEGVRWGRDLGLGLLGAGVVIALSEWFTRGSRRGRELAAELGGLIGPLGWGACALLAALSGFAEEVFFRGLLQPRLGWLLATLLFGLAHIPPSRSLRPWTGFALLAGAGLGGLFAWTGNLVAPVVAHACINLVNLRLLSLRYGGAGGSSDRSTPA